MATQRSERNIRKISPAQWLASVLFSTLAVPVQAEVEFSGKVDLEARIFTEDALRSDQKDSNLSILFEPQWVWTSDNQQHLIQFKPMLRLDQHDDERTHGDIREAYWIYVKDNWEVRTGLKKEFWGVTEFQHLVDVINQTDLVENISGEEKLGQPMINLSVAADSGIWDFYILPGFRERTFSDPEGRLSLPIEVSNSARFESSAKERHTDLAIRWSQNYDWLDLTASVFHGTNREPELQMVQRNNGDLQLVPYYEQMTQWGTTAQAIWLDWLFKLEAIHRKTDRNKFSALHTGFEYTMYGIADSDIDLGLIMEYGWDERGEKASSVMQNDLFGGLRFAFNDEAGTEILAGLGHDMDFSSQSFSIEASQRLNNYWKISGEVRFFESDNPKDSLYTMRKDDYLQLTLSRYF